ncbi:lipoprotein [Advenella sp. RU8]|uniref:lipoprotein n=1 Tax=Advenella sp. RU8 TaxID=3399575 RepID=UPI003AAD7DEB
MKKIIAIAVLAVGLTGCVIDDGYGYYDDYYGSGYSNGYGYSNTYYNVNNYRYYDNNRRQWVTRSHADQKRYWDDDKKHINRNKNDSNRKPYRLRPDAKPIGPPREKVTNYPQNNRRVERPENNRRIEQNQHTIRRPSFNRDERPHSNPSSARDRSHDYRREAQRRTNDSR